MSNQIDKVEKEEAYRKLYQVLAQIRIARATIADLQIDSVIGNKYDFLFEKDKKEFVDVVGKTYDDLNKTINRIKRFKLNEPR